MCKKLGIHSQIANNVTKPLSEPQNHLLLPDKHWGYVTDNTVILIIRKVKLLIVNLNGGRPTIIHANTPLIN